MSSLKRIGVGTSLVLTSFLGCWFIQSYWAGAGTPSAGVPRCSYFVAVMLLLHVVGYLALKESVHSEGKQSAGSVSMRRLQEHPIRFIGGLAVAVTCFGLAIGQFQETRRMMALAKEWEQKGRSLPPTMISEHGGACVALICVGLIGLLVAFRHGPETARGFEMDNLKQNRDEIIRIAARYGARRVRVFGSVARSEAGEKSDVDFLIDLEAGRSLLDQVGMQQDLESLLGCRVDLVVEGGISPYLEAKILAEATPL